MAHNETSASSSTGERRLTPATHELLLRYVRQMRHGCGNSSCVEPFCLTGATNLAGSHKPVRILTSRSARTTALYLVSSPNASAHLCRYSSDELRPTEIVDDTKRRDPSSLTQLLVDTPPISDLFRQRHSADDQSPNLDHLAKAHKRLDLLLTGPLLGEPRCSNVDAAASILIAINTLVQRFPQPEHSKDSRSSSRVDDLSTIPDPASPRASLQQNPPASTDIDHTDSTGPPTQCHHTLVPSQIRDYFDYEPHHRLCEAILLGIARRTALEDGIQHAQCAAGAEVHSKHSNRKLLPLIARRLDFSLHETLDSHPLVIWLKRLVFKLWNGQPMIKRATVLSGALEMLEALAVARRLGIMFSSGIFQDNPQAMATAWIERKEHGGLAARHILSFRHVTSLSDRTIMFRMICHLKMRRTQTASRSASLSRQRLAPQSFYDTPSAPLRYSEEHYLLLNVSRDSVLSDAFSQLWQRRQAELFRPLRVRLGEIEAREVGQDLGGVQIEFFNLVCRTAFAEDYQMFATDSDSGISYFRAMSLQPLHTFELLGLLMSLVVFSAITVPVTLPLVFYQHLLAGPDGLHRCEQTSHDLSNALNRIRDGWPVLFQSLSRLNDEDNISLDFAFPLEANGYQMTALVDDETESSEDVRTTSPDNAPPRKRLIVYSAILDVAEGSATSRTIPSIEPLKTAWPGWTLKEAAHEPEEVTPNTKAAYVLSFINFLTHDSVQPQLDAFKKGFFRMMDHHSLSLFHSAGELKLYVEGESKLDLHLLQTMTQYESYDRNSEYIKTFWDLVEGWPEEKQKALLKFVTAMERIPITANWESSKRSGLTFVIKRVEPEDPDALPTSSTCFGILSLPEYPDAQVLNHKLSIALAYGLEGFGTV